MQTWLSPLLRLLAGVLLVLAARAGAADLAPVTASAASGGNALLDAPVGLATPGTTAKPAFLPVAQAYPLDVDVTADTLQLRWDITPGYYLYRVRMGLALLHDGERAPLAADWPRGKPYDDPLLGATEIYRGTVTVSVPLAGGATTLEVKSQGCADAGLCYPPRTQYFSIDPAAGTAIEAAAPAPLAIATAAPAAFAPAGLAYMALLAFAGGMILNLMPCVFPVLSLKALGMAGHADAHRGLQGAAYTAGVVLSFLAVAAVLLALRGAGAAIGWGFHLQSPVFVGALVYLFVAMGLGLAGVVNLGAGFMGIGSSLAAHSGYTGSFFTGVLATIVASPCSAPFMGTALGFALAQPPAAALTVFAALGLGMAAPFLLLSLSPGLLRRLPRPGAWMETFKQFLAFPVLIAAVWLLWVLGNQGGVNAMALVTAGCVVLAFALWLWEHGRGRRGLRLLALLLFAACAAILDSPLVTTRATPLAATGHWEPYSPARLAALRAAGKPVFVNVTADWCLTCLANEKIALDTDAVRAAFTRAGITALKGDWTNSDPELTRLLNAHGRSGVPLYLYYGPGSGGSARILPQLLTPDSVIAAITNPPQTAANEPR